MYRVHIHLASGEKLRSFKAQEFDINPDKKDRVELQEFTYTDPDSGEEKIYLNPKEVAAIELRPTRASAKSKVEETKETGEGQSQFQYPYFKSLPASHDGEESDLNAEEGKDTPKRSRGRRTWMPPEDSDVKDGSTEDQDSPLT